MTLVHQQRDHAKARYRESRDDITLTRSQMQELVNIVKELSEEVTALRKDVDKKGEKK